jgi:hypothetical protein
VADHSAREAGIPPGEIAPFQARRGLIGRDEQIVKMEHLTSVPTAVRHVLFAALIAVSAGRLPFAACLAKDAPPAADAATIAKSVERGATYLKARQRGDGSWDGGSRDAGVTALAVYALIKAGTPAADPAVSNGIRFVLTTPTPSQPQQVDTYTLSLTAMALSAAVEKSAGNADQLTTNMSAACRDRLQATAGMLVAAQHRCRAEGGVLRGPRTPKAADIEVRPFPGGNGYDLRPFRGMDGGAWGYTLADSNYVDNSNTQFALLGLRAAQNVVESSSGASGSVPREVWARSLARLVAVQAAGGEWDYGTPAGGTKGFQETMTPAGIGSLIICLSSLVPSPDIAKIVQTPEIAKALGKLERYVYPPPNVLRFDSSGLGGPNRTGYMFYSLERACMLGGVRNLGSHDWYAEGAAEVLRAQQADGSWAGDAWYNAPESRHKSPKSRDNTVETAFHVLFLTKAFVRTPAQKPYTPSR